MKTRIMVVFAAVILAPIFVTAQNQPSGAQKGQDAQQSNPSAPISVDCNCATQTEGGKNNPQGWHKLVTWPEGIATWALMFTLGAIIWQSCETRRAAGAANKSIHLQEVALRQWVNIVPIGISKCVRPDRPGLCEVSLQFEIINKTDYLMTILRIETSVGANVHESTESVVDCDQPLVPQKSDGDSSHPFYAKTLVDAGIWNEKGRIFVVTGTVTYLDCMEIRRTQTFEDLYLGIDDGELRRMKPSGIGKTVEDDQQPQNPN